MIRGRAHLLGDFFITDLHFTNKYDDRGQSIDEIAAHALEAFAEGSWQNRARRHPRRGDELRRGLVANRRSR